jgi:hypothetical protein
VKSLLGLAETFHRQDPTKSLRGRCHIPFLFSSLVTMRKFMIALSIYGEETKWSIKIPSKFAMPKRYAII